jgi:hypothetical protein
MRLNPRYWVHVANKRLPIIHPNAWYRISWDVFVLVLVLYNAIIVPYQVGLSRVAHTSGVCRVVSCLAALHVRSKVQGRTLACFCHAGPGHFVFRVKVGE